MTNEAPRYGRLAGLLVSAIAVGFVVIGLGIYVFLNPEKVAAWSHRH